MHQFMDIGFMRGHIRTTFDNGGIRHPEINILAFYSTGRPFRQFTLVTERWRERAMTPELLRKLAYSMAEEHGSVEAGLVGSTILDQKGERLGVWYAPVPTSTVKILGEKEIRVDPPVLKDMDRSPLMRGR